MISLINLRTYFISSLIAVVFFLLVGGINTMSAASIGLPMSSVEFGGYLWSDTIGWVSLNCNTGSATGADICGTSNYKVVLDDATGQLSGWAWSNNIGWISFGKTGGSPGATLSGFPTVALNPGTTAVSAKATGLLSSGLTLQGWVRACAGTLGGDCSVMTDSAVAGGWDGWISLKGDTNPAGGYRVTMDSVGKINPNSYGWGNTVVGWLSFDLSALLIPNAVLTGTACTIARDASTCANGTLNWSFTAVNAASRRVARVSPTATPNIGGAPPALVGTSATVTFNAGMNTFQAYYAYPGSPIGNQLALIAGCAANNTYYPAPANKCDQTMPTVSITTDKSLVRSGATVLVSWTITPPGAEVLDASIVCKVSGPGMPNGAQTTSGSANSAAIKNGINFKITCTPPAGAGSDVTDSTYVDVVPTTQEI